MRYRPRRELSTVLRSYDLVQVVCGTPALACAVLGLGVPVVLQVATLASWERAAILSGFAPGTSWRRLMTVGTSLLDRRALARVDAVLVENEQMAAMARVCGQSRIRLAPPGVDTDLFSPPAEGWRRDGYLLSVCRLAEPRKGLDRLVRAYALMLREDPGTPDLVVAGKGCLPGDLVALVRALGVADRVRVRTNVPPAELVGLYQGASVFLQSSHEEGLGMSVVEATACGLPVVATATAGARETVQDGVTGWHVPLEPASEVPVALAARTRSLLSEQGREFGRRARERAVRRFSTRSALREVLDLYDGLLGGEPGGKPAEMLTEAAR